MKKTSTPLALFLFLPIFVFLGLFWWWRNGLKPVDSLNKEKINFVINKGDSLSKIAVDLKQKKLIRDTIHFRFLVFFGRIVGKIQAGNFYLSPSMSELEIASLLTHGSNDQRVTIIEGLRQEQIRQLFIDQEFVVDSKNWERQVKTQELEGKIFPDTYLFPRQATEGAILKIIERNFQKKVLKGVNREIQKSDLTLRQALIFASIVEREAKGEEDRRLVAGILLKRWLAGWPLQADATVQYAVATQNVPPNWRDKTQNVFDWWPKKLTQKDLEIESPYNTYKNRGLPPSPICNPGLSAIKAVLNPQNSTYWFYLSDFEGKIHYANSSEEHAKNIQKYLLGE